MMRHNLIIAAVLGLGLAAAPVGAQTTTAPPAVSKGAAEAEISAVLRDVYAVISGPKGQARDWAKMRTMFTPEARLTAIGEKGLQGHTLEEFIAKAGPFQTRVGFVERELAHRIEIFGDLAHAWSSYEGTGDDGKLRIRGINSFQLVRLNGRWLVQSIFWQAENKTRPLPADMLPAGAK